jgi:hypothetical protein
MAVQSAPPCGPHAKSIAFCSTAVGWSDRHTQKSAVAPLLLMVRDEFLFNTVQYRRGKLAQPRDAFTARQGMERNGAFLFFFEMETERSERLQKNSKNPY